MANSKLGDRRKKSKTHAYVCTPAYDGKVDCDYAMSLAEAAFCSPLAQVNFTAGVMGNGAFIELARNIFVRMFLEDFKDCSHLFFIDSDLKFEARAFLGLINSGHPICAGAYRRRQEPEDFPVRWTENPEVGGLWVEDGWVMCDRVPTGFLCISRPVLEEMAADARMLNIYGQPPTPEIFMTRIDEENRFQGEDFSFCDDYRERYGKPIPVWPDFDFVHGGFKCNFHEFLNRKIDDQEKGKLVRKYCQTHVEHASPTDEIAYDEKDCVICATAKAA